MQKYIENGINVLRADEGMMLTNNYTFGTAVYLGKEDDGSAWYEITEEEAAERMAEDIPSGDDATVADYQAELRRMGVKV